jgi:hypothetical protein
VKKKINEGSLKSQLPQDEGEEDWLTDEHWPDPDPKKVDAVVVEIAHYISDFVDRAAFDFLLTDGKFIEFEFPDDPEAPKPPGGESIPAWKMKWYSTLDPLFLLYLNRRAENFNLVRYDSQPDARSAHALSMLRETSDQLMLRMEQLSFYIGMFMGAKLSGASRDEMLALGQSLRRSLTRGRKREQG